MANGSGIEIDGNGSVRWQVVVEEDDDRKSESVPDGAKGRKTKGVDRSVKRYFRLLLKAPTSGRERELFLEQFAEWVRGDEVEIRLPLAKVDKQIKVKWDADGPRDTPQAAVPSS